MLHWVESFHQLLYPHNQDLEGTLYDDVPTNRFQPIPYPFQQLCDLAPEQQCMENHSQNYARNYTNNTV